MTQKDAQQEYNRELVKRQKAETFPDEKLPEDYNQWKHLAFQFMSMLQVAQTFPAITWDEIKVLLQKEKGFTLFEVSVINTSIQMTTPNELSKLTAVNYYTIQDRVVEINREWNQVVGPITEAIRNRISLMAGNAKPDYQSGGVRHINGGRR